MNLKLLSTDAHKYLYRHNRQRGGRRMSDWMENQDVCQALKISHRTLQDYRNNGILPYRQLGGKILYRESDIERVLQDCYRSKF